MEVLAMSTDVIAKPYQASTAPIAERIEERPPPGLGQAWGCGALLEYASDGDVIVVRLGRTERVPHRT
jgi:hypothetical protein